MDWFVIGGLAVIAAAYLFGKSDGEKDGFTDATAFYEQKEQERQWIRMMTRFNKNHEKEDEDEE